MTKLNSEKSKKTDYGAELLGNHHTLKAEFIGKSNQVRLRVKDQTSLDKLLINDSISLDQYNCIDFLYTDFHKAGMIGVKASSYSPRINATYEAKGERQAILRNKVIKCLSEVKHSGGARPYKILLKLMHDEEFTDSEINWIREFGNFDMIYKPTKKFYENWRTS